MRDEMSILSGVAASYASMPLSVLHQLQSVLTIEINERLLSFGEIKAEKAAGNVGDVESGNVADKVGNNVVIGNFKRGNK